MPGEIDRDALLTERELEQFLGVSRTTVWRLRRDAGLPFGRVGRKYLYRKSEILHWVKEGRAQGLQYMLDLKVVTK